MKANTKVIYISEAILLTYLMLFLRYINRIPSYLKIVSAIVVLTFMLFILLFFFGYKKRTNYLKANGARIVTASLMTYMLIIYSLGIVLGFNRGYFTNNLIVLLKNILPIVVFNVELEFVRYLIIKNSINNKKIIIIFTILSIILNVLIELNLGVLFTAEDKFIFLSTIIFPTIAKELICTYMTNKIAILPSLIYKLVINLYMYLLPIVPNLGNYIYSVINIIFPFLIYRNLNRAVIRYEKEKKAIKKSNLIVFTVPLIIFFIILVILISGIFKYKMIAIATNSMSPTYRRGDAVVYEKINVKDLKVGDVLAFQTSNVVVTHRIVQIWRQGDEYYFTTKGDNNNTEDIIRPRQENVLGKVDYIVKYIGYPTVLINEYFRKE